MHGRRGMARTKALISAIVALTIIAAITPGAHSRAAAPENLRIWYGSDDPTEAPLALSLAAGFARRHGVQVQLSSFGLDDINTKLQLAMSGGDPPDLIYTTPRGPGLPAYIRAGKLLDLTAEARRRGWSARLPVGMLAAYNNALSPSGRANGRVYAAPMLVAAVAVLYNQRLFNRLHLSVPHSLAAFAALCARVKAAGYVPIGFGNADGWVGDDWYLTLVNSFTGPAPLLPALHLDPHFSFGGKPFLTAGATLLQWQDAGYFTPQFGGLDAQDSVDAFFEGKTALQLVSSTENGQITALARRTGIPVGAFAFPSVDARQPPVMPQSGYAGWAIPRGSHQPALASAFIGDMLSDATAQALGGHGLLPARALSGKGIAAIPPFLRQYLTALNGATPGVYLDAAPVPNLNATMEANVQLLMQHFETPAFLCRSLQLVYSSQGKQSSATRTDGEF